MVDRRRALGWFAGLALLPFFGCGDDDEMAPPSIFQRPKRQIAPAVADGQQTISVSTLDGLKNAIGMAATRGTSSTGASPLATDIVIIAPIEIDGPIIIPESCAGLTIRAAGVVSITAHGQLANVFTVHAHEVHIIGLHVDNVASGAFAGFVSLDWTGVTGTGRIVISDNYFSSSTSVAGKFFSSTDVTLFAPIITNNIALFNVAGCRFTDLPGVYALISGNVATGASEGAVTNDAGSGIHRIIGNVFGGGNINTSVGIGLNTISANANIGVITANASDDTLGGNT